MPTSPTIRSSSPLGLALLLALLSSCGGEPPVRRSVLLVVLDTLSASRIACYGDPLAETPTLDRLASQSLRCERAFSSATYTLTSTASLFTGLSPIAHGTLGPQSNVLKDAHLTLAESFAEAGWRTAGISCNPHVVAEGGFDQGFAEFAYHERDTYDAHPVPAAALEQAREFWSSGGEEPRFLYLHLLQPHAPYDPPGARQEVAGTTREDGQPDVLLELHRSGEVIPPSHPLVQRALLRYRAGLTYVDEVLGELFDELGVWADEELIVALVSDHGEAFGEHGVILHGSDVHEELARVPLLLRAPTLQAGAHSGLVRTRDLGATLAQLAGAPWPEPDGERGRSMLEQFDAPDAQGSEVLTRSGGDRPVWCLRSEQWTLVYHAATESAELYDTRRDPREEHDLAPERPRVVASLIERLNQRLDQDRERGRRAGPGRSTDAHASELDAQGYGGH